MDAVLIRECQSGELLLAGCCLLAIKIWQNCSNRSRCSSYQLWDSDGQQSIRQSSQNRIARSRSRFVSFSLFARSRNLQTDNKRTEKASTGIRAIEHSVVMITRKSGYCLACVVRSLMMVVHHWMPLGCSFKTTQIQESLERLEQKTVK